MHIAVVSWRLHSRKTLRLKPSHRNGLVQKVASHLAVTREFNRSINGDLAVVFDGIRLCTRYA